MNLDEAYRITSGPFGYSFILAAIAILALREALRVADRLPRSAALGGLALVLTASSFAIIGVRVAALAL